jgi:hypothetical protein
MDKRLPLRKTLQKTSLSPLHSHSSNFINHIIDNKSPKQPPKLHIFIRHLNKITYRTKLDNAKTEISPKPFYRVRTLLKFKTTQQ